MNFKFKPEDFPNAPSALSGALYTAKNAADDANQVLRSRGETLGELDIDGILLTIRIDGMKEGNALINKKVVGRQELIWSRLPPNKIILSQLEQMVHEIQKHMEIQGYDPIGSGSKGNFESE